MILGIDPKVDYVFKRLFGVEANRPLLMHLLNAVLHPPQGQQVVDLQIRNPFIDKETWDDKLSIVDIRAQEESGRQFHVEMQLLATRVFLNRVLFYWAGLFQDQLQKGQDYQKLQPTISICFVNSILFPQTADYHLPFRLLNPTHQLAFTDLLAIHLIEFPKFTRPVELITDPLEVWCYFFRHAQTLDKDQLPVQLNIPPIQQALEVMTVITQNDLERERYQDRLKRLRDDAMILHEAEEARHEAEEARKELEEVREIARQARENAFIGRIHLCQRITKQPLTPKEELQAKSLDQLEELASQLEQQVLPPG